MEAANYYKSSNDKSIVEDSIVPTYKNDCKLAYILQKGTMVIFYRESADEVWEYSPNDFAKNLYYVSVIESDGRVTFKFHQEARQKKDIPKKVETQTVEPMKRIGLGSANILVQGYDFEINELGEIKRLR